MGAKESSESRSLCKTRRASAALSARPQEHYQNGEQTTSSRHWLEKQGPNHPWFGSNHLRLMVECCLVVDPKVGRASPPIVTPGLIQVPARGRANVAYCEPTLVGRFDALRG